MARKVSYIIIVCCSVLVIFLAGLFILNIHKVNREYDQRYNSKVQVTLRKFPYPYRAAITICSDIDNTETLDEFLEIQKFLNTKEMTSMGEGVGLEIGNSFLFYEPPDSISYFNGGAEVARTIRSFIQSGYIDVMHSYGKKSDFTREDAIRSLAELKKNNCKIDVWVDHDKSISNLGDDVTFGLGDHPDSKAYHADLTIRYGIRFAWLGRVTMISGQGVPITMRTFTSIFDASHPIESFVNVSKEFGKNVIAVYGNRKYAMHENNDLVKITELDDGQKVYEFIRFDDYWEGVSRGGNNKRLAYVISPKTLTRLEEVGGYMIVYTHLGMNSDCTQYICIETQKALRILAKEFEEGNIYVTTTSKLLNYYVNHKYLDWSYDNGSGSIAIYIRGVKDPIFGFYVPTVQDLEGVTFFVPDKNKATIYLNNKRIENVRKNPPDCTARESITITSR